MRRPLTGVRRSVAAALRRRAQPCGPLADGLRPREPEGSLFRGARRPLRRVLEQLQGDSSRIERAWKRLLRRLEPSPNEYAALAAMNLARCYRPLSAGGRAGAAAADEAYRLAVAGGARTLMRSGVPEDHALAAVAFYLEASLACLDRAVEARTLVRLTSATQRLVAAGYGEERWVDLRKLDDRERQRLSGDLHDEVGADLVVLKLYVEMIAGDLAKGRIARLGPKLREALALIAHCIASVRRLSLDLGPALLDSLGFLPALRSCVRQFSHRTGIEVALEETGAGVKLPASHETALYRVLRGALSNVAKHSKARHATVTLSGARGVFAMTVEDDGEGFDARALGPEGGTGITGMRERIRALGGELAVDSRNAGRRGGKSGTRVLVRLPLRARLAS